jgi:hypothetical protein
MRESTFGRAGRILSPPLCGCKPCNAMGGAYLAKRFNGRLRSMDATHRDHSVWLARAGDACRVVGLRA